MGHLLSKLVLKLLRAQLKFCFWCPENRRVIWSIEPTAGDEWELKRAKGQQQHQCIAYIRPASDISIDFQQSKGKHYAHKYKPVASLRANENQKRPSFPPNFPKGRVKFWKSSGGGVIFSPKIYIADFGNFKQDFLIVKFTQNSNFKVQGRFFEKLPITPISGNHVHAFRTIWPSYLLAYMQPYQL